MKFATATPSTFPTCHEALIWETGLRTTLIYVLYTHEMTVNIFSDPPAWNQKMPLIRTILLTIALFSTIHSASQPIDCEIISYTNGKYFLKILGNIKQGMQLKTSCTVIVNAVDKDGKRIYKDGSESGSFATPIQTDFFLPRGMNIEIPVSVFEGFTTTYTLNDIMEKINDKDATASFTLKEPIYLTNSKSKNPRNKPAILNISLRKISNPVP